MNHNPIEAEVPFVLAMIKSTNAGGLVFMLLLFICVYLFRLFGSFCLNGKRRGEAQ